MITINKLNLSDYDIGDTLGTGNFNIKKGSFGRVRIAKNKKNGNYYAIKIMKKLDIINSKQTDHIVNEIKILSYINHPFIIIFDGFCQDDKYLYISLELVNGGELFTYLRGVGRFEVEQSK